MICAVVLAAGRSRRMGAQKLLLPFAGKTVIAHIVDQLRLCKVDRVFVVVGSDAKAVAVAVGDHNVSLVHNPDPDAEMLSSVRCGFAAMPEDCRAVLIALGDQPSIVPSIVDPLIGAFLTGDYGIVVPFHDNHRGHPIIVSTRYRNEIMTAHNDAGLRGLLDAHPDDLFKLPAGQSVLEDMDYPEDYQRALQTIAVAPNDLSPPSRSGRGLG